MIPCFLTVVNIYVLKQYIKIIKFVGKQIITIMNRFY